MDVSAGRAGHQAAAGVSQRPDLPARYGDPRGTRRWAEGRSGVGKCGGRAQGRRRSRGDRARGRAAGAGGRVSTPSVDVVKRLVELGRLSARPGAVTGRQLRGDVGDEGGAKVEIAGSPDGKGARSGSHRCRAGCVDLRGTSASAVSRGTTVHQVPRVKACPRQGRQAEGKSGPRSRLKVARRLREGASSMRDPADQAIIGARCAWSGGARSAGCGASGSGVRSSSRRGPEG